MKKFIIFILSFIIGIGIINAECYSEVVNNRLKDFITNFNDKDKEILFR